MPAKIFHCCIPLARNLLNQPSFSLMNSLQLQQGLHLGISKLEGSSNSFNNKICQNEKWRDCAFFAPAQSNDDWHLAFDLILDLKCGLIVLNF